MGALGALGKAIADDKGIGGALGAAVGSLVGGFIGGALVALALPVAPLSLLGVGLAMAGGLLGGAALEYLGSAIGGIFDRPSDGAKGNNVEYSGGAAVDSDDSMVASAGAQNSQADESEAAHESLSTQSSSHGRSSSENGVRGAASDDSNSHGGLSFGGIAPGSAASSSMSDYIFGGDSTHSLGFPVENDRLDHPDYEPSDLISSNGSFHPAASTSSTGSTGGLGAFLSAIADFFGFSNDRNVAPLLLDLDGNGVSITELSRSHIFMDAGGAGLQHRTAWVGAGDGVLYLEDDGKAGITEKREYVFTEWDPTAADDLSALRAVFDSNGDGKLTAADARFADFRVLVSKPDGSTEIRTLAQLGITEIGLTADATRIELPDVACPYEVVRFQS